MLTTLADAMVSALNAETFSIAFTAERKWLPYFTQEEVATLKVTVVPRSRDSSIEDRETDQEVAQVDIAVQRHVSALTNAEIDPLNDLTEEIADFLNRNDLGDWEWIGTEFKSLLATDVLRANQVYTSVVTLSYRQTRDAS
jgi:hypothetical protein